MAFPAPTGRVGHPDPTQNIGQTQPPREPEPEPHIDSQRPGELVGIDCFFVGRLHGTKGPIWQITAIDTHSSYAWADLVVRPPSARPLSTPPRLRAASRQNSKPRAGNSSASSPTTAQSSAAGPSAHDSRPASAIPRSAPAARRPTATSNDCTARSSKNAGGPPLPAISTSASPACGANSPTTCTTTTSTANTTDASPTADGPQTSSTVPARWSRDEPHLSAHPGGCSA